MFFNKEEKSKDQLQKELDNIRRTISFLSDDDNSYIGSQQYKQQMKKCKKLEKQIQRFSK